jgi:hypothetical protein
MALSYPLTFPSLAPARIVFRARSVVGVQPSPLTMEHTVYAWQGDLWEADIDMPPMETEDAEPSIGMLLALNGMEGTFLMGPANAGYAGARGTWSGSSPVVNGAHAVGARTLSIRSVDGKDWKAGDWFQLGSGSTSRLHKVVQDGSQTGSPSAANLEIFPRLRAAVSNGDALTLSSPKGMWRLASNVREWSIEIAQIYGIRFSCIEDRSF